MAYTNRVDTVTNNELVPQVVDTVLNANVLTSNVLSNPDVFRSSTKLIPVKYQKGVAGTSFSGFDTLSTTASDTRVNMTFTPKFYSCNVALPGDEILLNNTEQQTIDLVALEMQSRAQDMADEIGTLLYADGTGNSSKDFLGMEALVDDGTNTSTIGGLSRSTYTTLSSTVTASSGTISLAKIRTLYNAISDANVAASMVYTTKAIYGFVESLLQPQERIYKNMDGKGVLKGVTGYKSIEWMGIPVVADAKCTSGVFYMVNEDFLKFYAVKANGAPLGLSPVKLPSSDIVGSVYSGAPNLGFFWTGWVKPTNAFSVVGHIVLGGQFITENPKRHGKLTGITGI
jgi:hypothetical protein